MYKIGIDTGGTNTDVILADIRTGRTSSAKVPTTPNLIEGIGKGIGKIVSIAGVGPKEIEELTYGTTIVVNMIAQKQLGNTALITTKGFRDVLEIGRGFREKNIYDIQMEKPKCLIERDSRYEVTERINFRGEIIEPLKIEEVKKIIEKLKEKRIKAIAVCFLHSYINPIHENEVKKIIKEEWPEIYVSLSSDVNPQFREYERTSTTAINAYMMPNMISHLMEFKEEIKNKNISPKFYIMQANAGVASFDTAINKPVSVANSGPIAGITAANQLAKILGLPNIISFDMGGTSCDVSLIQDNVIKFSTESNVEGYPISIPAVELNFIGAGGGSIAWFDPGGALKVGPLSMGAFPGPVCYQRGGTEPTVTDANLIVGRIRPEIFLENLTDVLDETKQVIFEKIARPLDIELMEAAEGILQVVNSNMMRAIRNVSVEKGYNPRDFALLAYGGAGPIHAAKLAEELEIPKVVVPYSPGTFSALGLLLSDVKYDFVYSNLQSQDQVNCGKLNEIYINLERRGIKELRGERIPVEDRLLIRTCDMRYFGQAFELNVPVPPGNLNEKDIENIIKKFHEMHQERYGHAMKEPVEFVNYRVSAIGQLKKFNFKEEQKWETNLNELENNTGKVVFDGKEYNVPIFDRSQLKVGSSINGPAIIGEMGATTVIYPGQKANIDKLKNITIIIQAK